MARGEWELRLEAAERYYQSARYAEIMQNWARLRGKSLALLRYEDVARRLHLRQHLPPTHQMVPLHHIVGSVGRYREFTQGFLPRRAVLKDRWVAIDVMMNSLAGLPPVQMYKIGEGYFVVDGNHRISVARANGNKDIEAIVTEWQTSVPFTLEDFTGDRWVVKAAYADFLAQTELDRLRPGIVLDATDSEVYPTLLQHIEVHRYLCNTARFHGGAGHVLSWHEAVVSWFDNVYMPVVEAMRTYQLHRRFPKRTETDLYLAVTHYRERIAEQYELAPLDPVIAVKTFAADHSDDALMRFLIEVQRSITHKLRVARHQPLRPAGMTREEFGMLRLRHDAGELSLTEASRKQRQEEVFGASSLYEECVCVPC